MHPRSVVKAVAAGVLAVTPLACGSSQRAASGAHLSLSSPALTAGATLPRRYTCDGTGTPPPLAIAGVPRTARSLAVVVDDPDAPGGDFTHWVVFDLPPSTRSLPAGGREARNGLGRVGYGAPCPPPGARHRYVFSAYALSAPIELPNGAPAETVRAAIGRSALASGTFVSRYARTP